MESVALRQGLDQMGLSLSEDQQQRLLVYIGLLERWNKAYNLTAIRDPRRMIPYHLLDSLALMPFIPQQAVCLDVGTGAGLPGLPLAVAQPQTEWVLLDANGKKTRFVQQAIAELGLRHVKVVQSRVEDYHAASAFDIIVSRAFASLADFVAGVQAIWRPGAQLLTMKTELTEAESAALDRSLYALEVVDLRIPGIAEQRSLVRIERLDQ